MTKIPEDFAKGGVIRWRKPDDAPAHPWPERQFSSGILSGDVGYRLLVAGGPVKAIHLERLVQKLNMDIQMLRSEGMDF